MCVTVEISISIEAVILNYFRFFRHKRRIKHFFYLLYYMYIKVKLLPVKIPYEQNICTDCNSHSSNYITLPQHRPQLVVSRTNQYICIVECITLLVASNDETYVLIYCLLLITMSQPIFESYACDVLNSRHDFSYLLLQGVTYMCKYMYIYIEMFQA